MWQRQLFPLKMLIYCSKKIKFSLTIPFALCVESVFILNHAINMEDFFWKCIASQYSNRELLNIVQDIEMYETNSCSIPLFILVPWQTNLDYSQPEFSAHLLNTYYNVCLQNITDGGRPSVNDKFLIVFPMFLDLLPSRLIFEWSITLI